MNIFLLLIKRLLMLPWSRPYTQQPARVPPGRRQSVFLRHLDCGSCNGCELELMALTNPIYDIERFGLKFVASPRHADVLVMTGPFTQNLAEAARLTFDAMSQPRQIVAIGDCAIDGGVFKSSYAVTSRPEMIEEAIAGRVQGCPPTPEAILQALLELPAQTP